MVKLGGFKNEVLVRFTLIIVLKPHTPLLVLDSHQLNYPLALPWVLPGDILKALALAKVSFYRLGPSLYGWP